LVLVLSFSDTSPAGAVVSLFDIFWFEARDLDDELLWAFLARPSFGARGETLYRDVDTSAAGKGERRNLAHRMGDRDFEMLQ
jgi:hypothetical protein